MSSDHAYGKETLSAEAERLNTAAHNVTLAGILQLAT
jgi:hypothetical protein